MLTTLNLIRQKNPCANGWAKLLTYLNKTKSDDETLSIATILDSNGLDDALWALRAVEGYDREIRLLACAYARHVLPSWEIAYPNDKRPAMAIETAEHYAVGQATGEGLAAASSAAMSAAESAAAESAAESAAVSAARAAAVSAAWAAWDAASSAAMSAAAWDAAESAARAAESAARAARAAESAWSAEREWQAEQLRAMASREG